MRKAVGISGLRKKAEAQQRYRETGENLADRELQLMKERFRSFQTQLQEFSLQYKKMIRSNAEFRSHFQEMCQKMGVDPLTSNKGIWTDLLGFGDFYYELAVQIVDICLAKTNVTGGLVSISVLLEKLISIRGPKATSISAMDVKRAIKSLDPLKSGFACVKIGEETLVQSYPREFSEDILTLFSIFQKHPSLTMEDASNQTHWQLARVQLSILALLKEGLLWIDTQSKPPAYSIPRFL